MKRPSIILIIFFFCFLSNNALAEQKYVPERIIIKVQPGVMSLPEGIYESEPRKMSIKAASISNLNTKFKVKKIEKVFKKVKKKPGLTKLGRKTVQIPDLSNFYIIHLPEGSSIEAIIEEYKKDLNIEYVSPDYLLSIYKIPNDPLFKPYRWRADNQWGLFNICAPSAWDYTTGNSSQIIAVLDTGVNYYHEDLAGKVILGPDYVNKDNNPMDDNGHGTHVAGIAGAISDNGKGIAGVDWNCRILAVKVFDASGNGSNSDIADGIRYAADHGANVINMSFGGSNYSQPLKDAVDYAYASGCVLIAAAGNENTDVPRYPAAYNNVVAVAATDKDDNKADYSNFGLWVDISAPGGLYWTYNRDGAGDWAGRILSCGMGQNDYVYKLGTSMAAPFVSGAAALILSVTPEASPDEIENILKAGADKISNKSLGVGRINIGRSLFVKVPPLPENMPIISDFIFDKYGNQYVVYCREGKVVKYNSLGEEVASVSSFRGMPFYFPYGIACSPSGDKIYVSDTYNHRVIIFNDSLQGIRQISGQGVFAIFTCREVYEVFLWNVQKSEEDWATHTIPGEGFECPKGISVDDNGYVYVADSLKGRVLKYDSNGNPVRFDNVLDVGAYSVGRSYLGLGDAHIWLFGHKVYSTSYSNTIIGTFNSPYSLTAQNVKGIYVSDTLNNRVKIYNFNGSFVKNFSAGKLDTPVSTYVDPYKAAENGSVYIADQGNHRVQRFTDLSKYVCTYGDEKLSPAPQKVLIKNIDGRDVLYVCDATKRQIISYLTDNPPSDFHLTIPTNEVYYINDKGMGISWSSTHESDFIKLQKYQIVGKRTDRDYWEVLNDDISPEVRSTHFVCTTEGEWRVNVRALNGTAYRDSDGGSDMGDPQDQSRQIRLICDLYPPKIYDFFTSSRYFSPDNSGNIEATFKVSNTKSDKIFKLNASVHNWDGTLIKTLLDADDVAIGKYDISWDGKTENGTQVPDGKYKFVIKAMNENGNYGVNEQEIFIDTTKPQVVNTLLSSNMINPTSGYMNNMINFKYKIIDTSPDITEQLNIFTLAGARIKTYERSGTPGIYYETWDGRDEINNIVSDGQYKYEITAKDIAGNISDPIEGEIIAIKNPTVLVNVSPTMFSPNNDGYIDSTTISYNIDYYGQPITGESQIIINIYDQSGTKCYFYSDTKPQGSYAHVWNGESMYGGTVPDGVYTADINVSDPLGTKYNYQTIILVDSSPPTISDFTLEVGGQYRSEFNPYKDNGITMEFSVDDLSLSFPLPLSLITSVEVWNGSTKIATIMSTQENMSSSKNIIWTGLNDLNDYVNEGQYQIKVSSVDFMNNLNVITNTIQLEDDVRVSFTYPDPGINNVNGDAIYPILNIVPANKIDVQWYEGWNYRGSAVEESEDVDSGQVKSDNVYFYADHPQTVRVETWADDGLNTRHEFENASGWIGVWNRGVVRYVDTEIGTCRVYVRVSSSGFAGSGGTIAYFSYTSRYYHNAQSLYNSSSNPNYYSWSDTTSDPAPERQDNLTPRITSEVFSGSTRHKVYTGNEGGYTNLFYQRSINGGTSWSLPCKLTHSSNVSNPGILCEASGNSYVAWEDGREGHKEIYFQKIPSNFAPVNSPGYTILAVPKHIVMSGAVILAASSTIELISPINGATVNTLRPTFKWYGVQNQPDYRIECATTSDAAALDGSLDYWDYGTTTISDVSSIKPICEYIVPEHSMGLDESTPSNPLWYWRVRTINTTEASTSEVGSFKIELPVSLSGVTNWPNPFNPNKEKTKIRYRLGRQADTVTIRIYDITGALVKELDGTCNAEGSSVWNKYNDVEWDGRNGRGDMVLNGVYPFEVIVESTNKTVTGRGKAVVLK
jgi:thermitase